jgi:hypothetical protein
MSKRAKELAEAHWSYIGSLLKVVGLAPEFMPMAQHLYTTALIHGHKHGVEDERGSAPFLDPT